MAGLRFLVLDEADRMIENGHFAELDKIIRLTLRPELYVQRTLLKRGHLILT